MKSPISIPLCLSLLFPQPCSAELSPASFAYILQADSLAKSKPAAIERLTTCNRDWIVLDADFNSNTPWERKDIATIRSGQAGRKVIAYISIGEAEDYRSYWLNEWGHNGKLTPDAPTWLGAENPAWKGNYRVKYWQAGWQRLILSAVDTAMTRGFDGVYLDIVDSFETFEQDGRASMADRVNPETRQSYRRDMVDWVKVIAARARAGNPDALIIPQNGSQLLAHTDFLEVVSAMGIEDLFSNGKKAQPGSHTGEVLGHLRKMAAIGKPVLLIEYPKTAELQSLAIRQARENGLVWLVTDRQLKTLGESGK